MGRSGRVTAFHVSQMSREKHEVSVRAPESAPLVDRDRSWRLLPLGGWFLPPAEPDIHLLPQAPESHRRRLSLCSLPVPKQLEEGLGSCLRRPGGHLRDLAACASIDPDIFPLS